MRLANARIPSTSSSSTASVWPVDLRQRQLLAEPVALAAVGGKVDRFRVQKRLVQPVELLTDRLDPSLLLRSLLCGLRASLLPDAEDAVFDKTHIARCRLEGRQFIDERA